MLLPACESFRGLADYEAHRSLSTCESTGENPAPGIEYLGRGYNIFFGNPRGDSRNPLDPGYVFPILDLATCADSVRSYSEPYGSSLVGTKTCKADKEAREITSTSDYQETLNEESTEDVELSTNIAFLALISFSSSTRNKFTKSENFKSFEQEKETLKTTSFENKVTCIDYSVRLNPYADLSASFDATYAGARDALFALGAYDPANDAQKAAYEQFFEVFGTHIITGIDMGGKYVVTSSINTEDVLSLTRNSNQVSKSLSFDASVSIALGEEEDLTSKLPEPANNPKEFETEQMCCAEGASIPKFASTPNPDYTPPPPAPQDERRRDPQNAFNVGFEFSSRFDSNQFSKVEKTIQTAKSIQRQEIYTIGGEPPSFDEKGDWTKWAKSIKANPMPIFSKYRWIAFIDPAFGPDQKTAFFAAIEDIYGVDVGPDAILPPKGTKYGVAQGHGGAISRYSLNPEKQFRSYLELEFHPSTESNKKKVDVYSHTVRDSGSTAVPLGSTEITAYTDSIPPSRAGYYLCGLQVKLEYPTSRGDQRGITGIRAIYCRLSNWAIQEEQDIYWPSVGVAQPKFQCDAGKYIVQFLPYVKYASTITPDEQGLSRLRVLCAGITGISAMDEFEDVSDFNPSDFGEEQPAAPMDPKPGTLVSAVKVQYGQVTGTARDYHGVQGFSVLVETATKTTGPPTPYYSYDLTSDLSTFDFPMVYSNCIRNKIYDVQAEKYDLGFLSKAVDIDSRTRSQANVIDLPRCTRHSFVEQVGKVQLAVFDFSKELSAKSVPAFTFLTIEEAKADAEFVAASVHPTGYFVSKKFGSKAGLEISGPDANKPNLVRVKFDDNNDRTCFASAVWHPSLDKIYPTYLSDVSVALNSCSQDSCDISVGAPSSATSNDNLGFNVYCVADSYENDNYIRGRVRLSPDHSIDVANTHFSSDTVTTTADFVTEEVRFKFGPGNSYSGVTSTKAGGVKITFPEFSDFPSVVVTPVIGDIEIDEKRNTGRDRYLLPTAQIESLTTTSAFIKVGIVNTLSSGFTVIADECEENIDIDQSWGMGFDINNEDDTRDFLIFMFDSSSTCLYWDSNSDDVKAGDCSTPNERYYWYWDGMRLHSHFDTSKCLEMYPRFREGTLDNVVKVTDCEVTETHKVTIDELSGYPGLFHIEEPVDGRCLYYDNGVVRRGRGSAGRICDGNGDVRTRLSIYVYNSQTQTTVACDGDCLRRAQGFEFQSRRQTVTEELNTDPYDQSMAYDPNADYKTVLFDSVTQGLNRKLFYDLVTPTGDTFYISSFIDYDSQKLGWFARNTTNEDIYITEDRASATEFEFETDDIFDPSPDLVDDRIKAASGSFCLEWEDDLIPEQEYDIKDLYRPVDFNIIIAGPRDSTTEERI